MINYLTLTLVKPVACPDILQNASRNKKEMTTSLSQVLDVKK